LTYLVAGFESKIHACSAANSIMEAARSVGVELAGIALGRRDTELGIHVERVGDRELPEHVLRALGGVVEADSSSNTLRPGETALVVSATDDNGLSAVVDRAALVAHGALWSTDVPTPPSEREQREAGFQPSGGTTEGRGT
jgi:hypothetical protein